MVDLKSWPVGDDDQKGQPKGLSFPRTVPKGHEYFRPPRQVGRRARCALKGGMLEYSIQYDCIQLVNLLLF